MKSQNLHIKIRFLFFYLVWKSKSQWNVENKDSNSKRTSERTNTQDREIERERGEIKKRWSRHQTLIPSITQASHFLWLAPSTINKKKMHFMFSYTNSHTQFIFYSFSRCCYCCFVTNHTHTHTDYVSMCVSIALPLFVFEFLCFLNVFVLFAPSSDSSYCFQIIHYRHTIRVRWINFL